MEDYDHFAKIVFVGDSGVGKTQVRELLTDPEHTFSDTHKKTIGVDFGARIVLDEKTKKRYKLQCWDTAGAERYRAIANAYYRDAKIVLVVWDAAKDSTFNNLENWLDEIKEFAPEGARLIFVRNKVDLDSVERKIISDEEKATLTGFADGRECRFVDVSAKDKTGMLELEQNIIAAVKSSLEQTPEIEEAPAPAKEDKKRKAREAKAEKEAAKLQKQQAADAKKQAAKAEKERIAREKAELKAQAKADKENKRLEATVKKAEIKRKEKLAAVQKKAGAQARKAEAKKSVPIVPPSSATAEQSSDEATEHLIKVMVLGDAGVGKTSLIKQWVHNIFSKLYKITIGVDFALKVVRADAQNIIRFQLWDVAGGERFASMMPVYLREAHMIFLVWDPSRANTFEGLEQWLKHVAPLLKQAADEGIKIPVVFIRGKSDLVPGTTISQEENDQIKKWARDYGFKFKIAENLVEISSQDNKGIQDKLAPKACKLFLDTLRAPGAEDDHDSDNDLAFELKKPGKPEYEASSYKHTRQARRAGLANVGNEAKDKDWLWMNWYSIYSFTGSSTVKKGISERLGSDYQPPNDLLSHPENSSKNNCALALLCLLDERETSIPRKIGTFFNNSYALKVGAEKAQIYAAAKKVYDNGTLSEADCLGLPNDAQKIIKQHNIPANMGPANEPPRLE